MKIILAGGTGFIGKELTRRLVQSGHDVDLLTRRPSKNSLTTQVQWDGKNSGPWEKVFDGADAVINLGGEPIAGKRWSEHQMKLIVSSRIETTRAVCTAISKASNKPKVLINASGSGYYGNRFDEMLAESAPPGQGFLAETCVKWEAEAKRAESYTRVVMLRTGIVLEKGGGALEKLLPPFYLFAGGPMGSGKQGMPWIHRDDVIGIIEYALNHPDISGPLNVVAPEILNNEQFSKILGRVLHRPSFFKTPGWTLKLLLGTMAEELLLAGHKPVPARLLQGGYRFKYADLESALRNILTKSCSVSPKICLENKG